MDDIKLMRLHDPQKGDFCKADKLGNPVNEAPVRRDPLIIRETNPRGVRHLGKTYQDAQAKDRRERVQAAERRRAWIQEKKPTRSGDYASMPR